MKFQIIWSDSAANELKKLDRSVSKRIFNKVSELCENPYHFDVIKMVGDPYFRPHSFVISLFAPTPRI
jgi:mRNA interferase RelE/StbE